MFRARFKKIDTIKRHLQNAVWLNAIQTNSGPMVIDKYSGAFLDEIPEGLTCLESPRLTENINRCLELDWRETVEVYPSAETITLGNPTIIMGVKGSNDYLHGYGLAKAYSLRFIAAETRTFFTRQSFVFTDGDMRPYAFALPVRFIERKES